MTHIDGERMKRLKALMADLPPKPIEIDSEEPEPTKTLSMREKLELALASAEKSVSAQFKAEEEVMTAAIQLSNGTGGVTLRELLESAAKGEYKKHRVMKAAPLPKASFSAAAELEKLKKIKELADKQAAVDADLEYRKIAEVEAERARSAAIAAYNEAVKQDLIKQSEPEPERPDSFGTWA